MVLLDRIKAKFNFGMGVCYETGKKVGQDYNEAVKYYTLAAEAGYADAQCNLGLCYLQGKSVEKDAAKAIEWYTKAAEQGSKGGQNNLGLCCQNGIALSRT